MLRLTGLPTSSVAAAGVAAALLLGGCGSADVESIAPTPEAVAPAAEVSASDAPAPPQDWQVVGTSVQDRPIRAREFGHGPRKVLFIGGIHGDEDEGAYTTAQLPAAFAEAGLGDAVTLTILEDANPDGRANGTRGNANGVDVNRNFPASNFDSANPANGGAPLNQPESRTVVELLDRVGPDLLMVAHAWVGKQFINFDGPAEQIAQRFSAASGLPVEPSNAFAPTPGSLGSYAGRDRGIPLLTVEVLKGSDPEQVWQRLRPALLEAIAGPTR